jgi:hypothetical protein
MNVNPDDTYCEASVPILFGLLMLLSQVKKTRLVGRGNGTAQASVKAKDMAVQSRLLRRSHKKAGGSYMMSYDVVPVVGCSFDEHVLLSGSGSHKAFLHKSNMH